jgi:hypothetical protein
MAVPADRESLYRALPGNQRATLEKTVIAARRHAETGARNALRALAVDQPEPFAHTSPDQRALRNRLRAKARLLGDTLHPDGRQTIDALAYELAYEYWHRMLFARFLEANHLLMHPGGVAVTMEECAELAAEEGFSDKWTAAAAYASRMLPAIFRSDDPLMQVDFAAEDRIQLETLLDALPTDVFTADDSLGWVYQFWQNEAKVAINKSEAKIDGARLPAVTQLFTEPYMVQFLIDNTIGAWWMSRHPGETHPLKFEYLRLLDDGAPAAGYFEGWPDSTAGITALDPCMGSGHFVAALFTVLARLRMHEEGLSADEAADQVIAHNLFGLELDPRCTQIAAFNLALAAWKFCGHYKPLPAMNLACSGLAPKGKLEDWLKLARRETDAAKKQRLENGLEEMYRLFQQAPELGSLLDPTMIKPDIFTANFEELQPYLEHALAQEDDKDVAERGVLAAGIALAGSILAKKYTLQITNVPYLARGKQAPPLADFCQRHYPDAKGDLATVFLDRMLKTAAYGGTVCSVIPQNWLFLTTYKKFRERLLSYQTWDFVSRLGPGAFSQISGEVVKAVLVSLTQQRNLEGHLFPGLDVSDAPNAAEKDAALRKADIRLLNQAAQLENPDARVVIEEFESENNINLLSSFADSYIGLHVGDWDRFRRNFWEIISLGNDWRTLNNSVQVSTLFDGHDDILFWPNEGKIHVDNPSARVQGKPAWGNYGIAVSMMASLPASTYQGGLFRNGVAIIVPKNQKDLAAIWCFCSSEDYNRSIRKIDQKLYVTSSTLVKVPFDLDHWQAVAAEKYPNGLPQPYSDDPTQWLFHGHPIKAERPLQVALARLLGYRWPAESDTDMELAPEARALIEAVQAFNGFSDEDGIVCLPPVNGEYAAAERLRALLQAVYGEQWSHTTPAQLLAQEGSKKSNLEDWLREEFFEQHCKLFHQRPFLWHIWDGRRDGFSAIVNYHKLSKENLQKLIYTYLGDWLRHCEALVKAGESGAEGLRAAALQLKARLEAILEGEAPYDIFVRWKHLHAQSLGWDPDLNDGVRLNIRPFMTADILRKKPNIKWGVDRGKNPPGSPWGEIRDNDRHLTLEEKRAARGIA